mmetsp:Transcript_9194/g.20356  ORF Transcript_9194/g.20356 Transcript_9194/m.20356 type:complete len:572 (-) Transcript_9194:254-1969(-)
MDPYKLLGVSANTVKHPSDLDKVRHRAKTLYKRFVKEKKKFDAKKVLEAYDMIKQKSKGTLGQGEMKILGRSRMERMMDKHYNHQTKEIKKNKHLKRALRRMQHGEKRVHLPGDKERIPTGRMARRKRRRQRRREIMAKRMKVDVLQGLQRLGAALASEHKFPKAVKLLQRWIREYMNQDNREFVFEVLEEVVSATFLTDDPHARQDIIEVFEYVLAFFSSWFEQAEDRKMMALYWRVATVLSCRCFTDDAFILASTIVKLNEAMGMVEEKKDIISDAKSDGGTPAALATPATPATPASPAPSPGGGISGIERRMELRRLRAKEELKAKEEKGELGGKKELSVKEETELEAKSNGNGRCLDKHEAKEEVKEEVKEELIDLDDVEEEMIDIDDDDGDDPFIDIDDDSDEDLNEEEISSDISSEVEMEMKDEEISSEDGEEVDDSVFPVPSCGESLAKMRTHFVDRCLAALFQNRGPLWARSKIDTFFQDIFYRRSAFDLEQQKQIEAWQSRIKTMQKEGERNVGQANNPMEAQRPVIDSREMRTTFDADSGSWAAKQTFDSRERLGGRNVIR